MILNYCVQGVDIGEDDMAEIGEEVRRRGRPPPLAVSVEKNFAARRKNLSKKQIWRASSKLVENFMSEAPITMAAMGINE